MRFVPTTLALAAAALLAGTAVVPAHADDLRQLRQQEKQRTEIFEAVFPDLQTARKAAISFHAELLEAHYDAGFLVMELRPAQRAALAGFGFTFRPASDFIARRDAFLDRIQAAADARARAGGRPDDVGIQSIPGYSCYPTVEETYSAAAGFVTTYPNLAQWFDIGDSWQKAHNQGGYDLQVLKLTNRSLPGPKPILFISAEQHAREYTTSPVALAYAEELLTGYGKDPEATWILDNHEVHLLLMANPDGRKKAEAGLSWRKNTNTAYCGATSNNRGADLNRNFTFDWNVTGGAGSSGNACDETYRGPTPASEPETQAIEAYVHALWPDRRAPDLAAPAPADTSGLHIDIHSYADLILWPWGETEQPSGNATALQTLGRRFGYYTNYTPTQSIGLYPTDGTIEGPSYGDLGVAQYTIEQGNAFFENCSSYTRSTKPKTLAALRYAAKVARAPYLLPAGPDVTSVTLGGGRRGVSAGTPVGVTAAITDTRFNDSNGVEPKYAIAAAEAYVDVPPWQTGATPIALTPADGAFDSTTETATGTLPTTGLAPGQHLVYVRGKTSNGAFGPVTAAFLTVRGRGD